MPFQKVSEIVNFDIANEYVPYIKELGDIDTNKFASSANNNKMYTVYWVTGISMQNSTIFQDIQE